MTGSLNEVTDLDTLEVATQAVVLTNERNTHPHNFDIVPLSLSQINHIKREKKPSTICKYFIAEKGKKLLATSIRLKRQYSENPDLLGVHLAVVLDVLGALTLSPVGVGHHLPQPLLPLRIVQRRRRSGRRRGRLFAPLARSAPPPPLFITSSVGLG